jgi:hypothetical protein
MAFLSLNNATNNPSDDLAIAAIGDFAPCLSGIED